MTHEDKAKLDGQEAGAQSNVKPDWNAVAGNAQEILNKPVIPDAYVLPKAGAALGGVKAATKTTESVGVKIDSNGNLFVPAYPTVPTDTIKYSAQTLDAGQKAQARTNIGAGTSNFSGSYDDLSEKPTIPTVPTISTDISADAASNVKTASPKAVADYVDANSDSGIDQISPIPSTLIAGKSYCEVLTANKSVTALTSAASGKLSVWHILVAADAIPYTLSFDVGLILWNDTYPTAFDAHSMYEISIIKYDDGFDRGEVRSVEKAMMDLLLRRRNMLMNLAPPVEPTPTDYLTFQSTGSFTLNVYDNTKHWDGTLYYSTDTTNWSVWSGTSALSSVDNKLYLRGTGNTRIMGTSTNYRWVLTGSNISCTGNIETLLDWETVDSGQHPTMANYCYAYMFYGCTSLTTAPALPAMTMADYCYYSMFRGCTSLTTAPELPATTLATSCYYYMFGGCTSLTTAPDVTCYNFG